MEKYVQNRAKGINYLIELQYNYTASETRETLIR